MLLFSGVILAVIATFAGLWLATGDGIKTGVSTPAEAPAGPGRDFLNTKKARSGSVEAKGEEAASGSHRQPLQFRPRAGEPAAMLAVLASGKQTVAERVKQLQGMRGISLSKEERESALAFLGGEQVPEGMGKGSMQWLADELLTVIRRQEPSDEDLAAELAGAAFQPATDPVVRDYIMQHLGHLWEQSGAREEIDQALWRAVDTGDETTPGTALIALSRGYERDQQEKGLAKVRMRAFELARNPATGFAVRVTALSIAGDGGGREVKELAADLARNDQTPVILRKVAERVAR
jgi:hypothetical protein